MMLRLMKKGAETEMKEKGRNKGTICKCQMFVFFVIVYKCVRLRNSVFVCLKVNFGACVYLLWC